MTELYYILSTLPRCDREFNAHAGDDVSRLVGALQELGIVHTVKCAMTCCDGEYALECTHEGDVILAALEADREGKGE